MGGALTTQFQQLMNSSSFSQDTTQETSNSPDELHGDPRSPSEGIGRTPLGLPKNVADPRSPTEGVTRTPLYGGAVEAADDQEESVILHDHVLLDPRSPTCGVVRTPIIADCDVHRNWDNNDSNDSMAVNLSVIPTLDLSSDEESTTDSNKGSMENLYNTSGTQDALDVANAEQDISSVSPIGSPTKSQSITEKSNDDEKIPLKSSTPNKVAQKRALTVRDHNSPLAIVQRKQSAQVRKGMTKTSHNHSGFMVAQDKENIS